MRWSPALPPPSGPTRRRWREPELFKPLGVDREDQRVERHDEPGKEIVVDMPRPGLGDGPHQTVLVKGDAFDPGGHGIAALDRAGRRVEPVELAPSGIAARHP